jgi:hypothetical protein
VTVRELVQRLSALAEQDAEVLRPDAFRLEFENGYEPEPLCAADIVVGAGVVTIY